jgi:hypothetical protein
MEIHFEKSVALLKSPPLSCTPGSLNFLVIGSYLMKETTLGAHLMLWAIFQGIKAEDHYAIRRRRSRSEG